MSEPRPAAVTAAARPILRRLPSLGPDRCRDLASEVLRAAQPYLAEADDQGDLLGKLRCAMAEYGLSPGQQAGIESACARLIEAAARRPYPVVRSHGETKPQVSTSFGASHGET